MRIAIIGAGRRAKNIYIPVLQSLPEVELAGIYSRNTERIRELASIIGTKVYASREAILADPDIDCIIACVDWSENAQVYQEIAASNKPCLLETPLGHNFQAINDSYNALQKSSAYVDIAEQYHLQPMEVLKRQLLSSGVFGEIVYAYSDGAAHEYHGVSLIRSYIGFDKSLTKVVAMQRDVPYFKHRTHEGIYFPGERIINSILEFSSGIHATFHWSWLNYKSPIRNRRSSGFYATKGAAWGNECVVLVDENSPALAINFERRTIMVNSNQILAEIVAKLEGEIIGRWTNQFQNHNLTDDQIVAAQFVERLIRACKDKTINPWYSPYQAYQDHIIVEEMHATLRKM